MINNFKLSKRVAKNTTKNEISSQRGYRRNINLSRSKGGGEYDSANNKAFSRANVHRLSIKRRRLSGIFLICLLSIAIIF